MLDEIVEATRARVAGLDLAGLRSRAEGVAPSLSLADALSVPGMSVIAEVKRRSPSRGELSAGLDPARQSGAYQQGGAAAISVLTEPQFFDGSLDDLKAVKAAVSIPVLRKDFIIEPAQIWESKLAGADAILLIVAALGDSQLEELIGEAGQAGLDALVEVHTAPEAGRAMASGATIVGVNNRDLGSFEIDLATAEALADLISDAPVRIAESGIFNAEHSARMAAAGYQAVLVGEALVRAAEPAALVAELKGAGI
ncbi:MAG: indole-3-glycerol phosphate synthase TrpC [Acidimicrobiia bacterium]